ncbi:unnamed protein product, partial [Symbiodinium sp. KB8]
ANESTSPKPSSTTETPGPDRSTSAMPEHDMATAPPTKEPPALEVNITTFHWEPHWQCAEVLKEGGGNICCDGQRGLAVLLVKPPNPVSNCETLCVMAVHPGHKPIQSGQSIVESVCGDARVSCAIAVGDWNVDAAGVTGGSFDSWHRLVGGNPPSFVVPDSETCCYPSTCCKFDHAVTNIYGAQVVKFQVWGYQLTDEFSMQEEHMPVSVRFTVPADATLTS